MTVKMNDGLMNVATGLGTRNDKAVYSTYSFSHTITQRDIEAAYQTSSWFRKIVEIPVDDSMRHGIDFQADETQIQKLEENLKRLKFWEKFKKARIMARRDGGAAIVMGLPGNPATPVDPTKVTLDQLKVITVLNRNQITPIEPIDVILDENFGQPSMYELTTAGEQRRIHPSRVLRFMGNERSDVLGWNGWGDSIYPPMRDAIINADTTSAAMAHMMHEANVDVMSIPGLTEMVATEQYEQVLMKRITVMGMLKSLVNIAVIDGGDGQEGSAETLDKNTYNFAGLSDVLASQLMVLSGVADIPATRLLGKSPDGMNASGDGDLRNYYDNIAAQQNNVLSPILDPFFEILIRSTLGDRPPELWYTWSPLYTLSEKEAADVEKIYAEVFTSYANNGLIRAEILSDIALGRMSESGQYPGIDKAMKKYDPTEIPKLEEPTPEEIALAQSGQPANGNQPAPRARVAANDATPKTLYVSRKVKNSAAIIKWAQGQGIPGMLPGAELHVTIVYSRTPIDWMKTGESWNSEVKLPAGGARLVELFGEGSIVLSFVSGEISYRHRNILEAGASHDWPDFQPHITIGYSPDPHFDVDSIEPYQGEIVLGPERYEELKS